MNAIIQMMVQAVFSLCCVHLPNGGLGCRDMALDNEPHCHAEITCAENVLDPYQLPACSGKEVLSGLDLRCCDAAAAKSGNAIVNCETPGTVLKVLPWCPDPSLAGLVSCPTGWIETDPGMWACA